jgi:dihydroxyacetone kinase-like predicted kinase
VAALEDDAFGYETVFVVTAPAGSELDVPAIQAHLETLGNSVLVGGDRRVAKIHVHNERPDSILAYGLSLGALTRITVENLDTMADDVREARAAAFVDAGGRSGGAEAPSPQGMDERRATGVAAVADPSQLGVATVPEPARGPSADEANGAHGPAESAPSAVPGAAAPPASAATSAGASSPADVSIDPALGPAIVAVVAGDGLEKVFRDFGVELIVRGGQAANPSTGELLRIARLARSREVIVLPNNPNVRLAAELAGRLCEDRRLVVVPTRNAAEGIAALLAFDPDAAAAENAAAMTAAGRSLATIQVTEAVRDAKIGGKKVKKGQTIALDPDDGLVAVDSDRDKAVLKAVGTFPGGAELVTLYYGEDASLMEAEAIARKIAERIGGEAEVVHGGQPHYRYLISAE